MPATSALPWQDQWPPGGSLIRASAYCNGEPVASRRGGLMKGRNAQLLLLTGVLEDGRMVHRPLSHCRALGGVMLCRDRCVVLYHGGGPCSRSSGEKPPSTGPPDASVCSADPNSFKENTRHT